jgi:hypothetical protein
MHKVIYMDRFSWENLKQVFFKYVDYDNPVLYALSVIILIILCACFVRPAEGFGKTVSLILILVVVSVIFASGILYGIYLLGT